MYCKNCGHPIEDGAAACTICGSYVGWGENYCRNCGAPVQPGAAVCTNCGFALSGGKTVAPPGARSKIVAGLLGIFLGGLGVHNFYLGYTGKAVAQLLLTVLSLGFLSGISIIWGLIDGIMILCGNIDTDANGVPLGE